MEPRKRKTSDCGIVSYADRKDLTEDRLQRRWKRRCNVNQIGRCGSRGKTMKSSKAAAEIPMGRVIRIDDDDDQVVANADRHILSIENCNAKNAHVSKVEADVHADDVVFGDSERVDVGDADDVEDRVLPRVHSNGDVVGEIKASLSRSGVGVAVADAKEEDISIGDAGDGTVTDQVAGVEHHAVDAPDDDDDEDDDDVDSLYMMFLEKLKEDGSETMNGNISSVDDDAFHSSPSVSILSPCASNDSAVNAWSHSNIDNAIVECIRSDVEDHGNSIATMTDMDADDQVYLEKPRSGAGTHALDGSACNERSIVIWYEKEDAVIQSKKSKRVPRKETSSSSRKRATRKVSSKTGNKHAVNSRAGVDGSDKWASVKTLNRTKKKLDQKKEKHLRDANCHLSLNHLPVDGKKLVLTQQGQGQRRRQGQRQGQRQRQGQGQWHGHGGRKRNVMHEQEDSSDREVIATDYDPHSRFNSPFVISKTCNPYDEGRRGEGKMTRQANFSKFRQGLTEVLKKPYDEKEHQGLLQEASRRSPITHIRNLRHGLAKSYSGVTLGKSYLDHYHDLAVKIHAANSDPAKTLNLLRGFFYWLQNLAHEGRFRPWQDSSSCLQVFPSTQVIKL